MITTMVINLPFYFGDGYFILNHYMVQVHSAFFLSKQRHSFGGTDSQEEIATIEHYQLHLAGYQSSEDLKIDATSVQRATGKGMSSLFSYGKFSQHHQPPIVAQSWLQNSSSTRNHDLIQVFMTQSWCLFIQLGMSKRNIHHNNFECEVQLWTSN